MNRMVEATIGVGVGLAVGLGAVLMGKFFEESPNINGTTTGIETPGKESQGGTTVVIFPDGQIKPEAADIIAVRKPGEPLPHPLFPAK